MADSTIAVGIAVDSGPAVSGLRNLEAAAKRAGVSVEEMQARVSKASAGAATAGARMAASTKAQSPALTAASRAAAAHATQLGHVATSTQKASAATAFFARSLQGMLVVLAGGGIYKLLEGSVKALAELGDRMRDTRLSGDTLQGLRIGAAEARVSTQELNKALDSFTAISKKAVPEAKEFYKALSAINPAFVSAFQAQAGKAGGQEERLRLIADALKSAKTETERLQLAQKALGTDNERVIDMFVKGRQALDDYIGKAREYGILVDEAFIKKAQDAERTLGILSTVIADKLRVAIVDILPDLMAFLPVLEKIGVGIMDIFANALETESRPLGTLNRELEDTRAHLQRLYKDRDAAVAANGDGGWAVSLGLSDNGLADLNSRIEKYEKYYERLSKAVSGNERAQFGPTLPSGGSSAPGFPALPGRGPSSSPWDSAVNSINRHIAAMTADAEAVGKTSAEHARLRVEAQLVEAGLRSGLSEAAVRSSEKFRELGQAAQDAAQKLALARVNDQIRLDRETSFLSQQDVQIAQQLRDIYPSVADALSSVEAQAMRVNDAMKELSSSIESNLTSGLTDIVSGTKSASDGFRDMANSIIKDIERMVIRMLVIQPLMRGLQGMLGGFGFADGGVFGLPSIGNGHGLYAKGGVFANDNIPAFAKGGTFTNSIVNSPTLFRFAQGTGLMGEAGPEAIMPLKRAPDGSLGVAAHGSSGGLAGLKIEVVNPPGVPQTASVERSSDGSTLRIVLKQAVEGIMADDVSSNGPISQMISARQVGFGGR